MDKASVGGHAARAALEDVTRLPLAAVPGGRASPLFRTQAARWSSAPPIISYISLKISYVFTYKINITFLLFSNVLERVAFIRIQN